jgi:hypothetical protein
MTLLTTYTQVPLATFYDWILPDIAGYVPALVDQKIREAAQDFCELTRTWRVSITPLDITMGAPEIQLVTDADMEIFELRKVFVNGLLIDPANESDLDAADSGWDIVVGPPTDYLLYDRRVIRLHPIPDFTIVGGLTGQAFLRPTSMAANLPSLFSSVEDVLAKGVKAKLMAMDKKPWSNSARAATLAVEFTNECARRAVIVSKGYTRAPLRSRCVHR